jgi:magnesium-transporting ATPase (P-type)
MTNKLLKLSFKAASGMGILGPFLAFAQSAPPLPTTNITSPSQVLKLMCDVAGWIFAFLMVLAVIFVLVAAFNYLTAQGDPEKVAGANQALIYAAVAVAVAVVAKALPSVVSGFVGSTGINAC